MNELIKISKHVNGVETVDARELHEFMESKQQFSDWIKGKIKKYDFIENHDYICIFHKIMKNPGRPREEYHLSLDMAKEIAMIENNKKGKEARDYFMTCEKKLIEIKDNLPILDNQDVKDKFLKIAEINTRTGYQVQKVLDFQQLLSNNVQNLELALKRKNKKQIVEIQELSLLADMVAERLDSKINDVMIEILDAIKELKE